MALIRTKTAAAKGRSEITNTERHKSQLNVTGMTLTVTNRAGSFTNTELRLCTTIILHCNIL